MSIYIKMLNSKNIATVAIVAIVLALGTARIVTAIGQGAHAQVTCEKGKCRGDVGKHNPVSDTKAGFRSALLRDIHAVKA